MEKQKLIDLIEGYGVIPVIVMESPDQAMPLADALIEGGLPVAEITFRTQAAAHVIEALTKNRPELIVGAGTILSVENLLKAQACGAAFGVSPGFNPRIVEKAFELNFPFFPGIMTPTDIERALSAGVRILKFFPAEATGGLHMLEALSAPYEHLGVRFIPTGGINIHNLESYLRSKSVLGVGGTWIADKDAVSLRQWNTIKENVGLVKKIVSPIRQKG
jgi:2-dehydro-3-deoxyphosphogluconate aldolase/(4S)-4-hydroxy-2-oxoglutarate aldolase